MYNRVYRYKRSDYDGSSTASSIPGTASPLAKIEEAIIAICIQMGRFRQPLETNEGISLANSLIEGTEVQKGLVKFQKENCGMTNTNRMLGKVGAGYWAGFNRQHRH